MNMPKRPPIPKPITPDMADLTKQFCIAFSICRAPVSISHPPSLNSGRAKRTVLVMAAYCSASDRPCGRPGKFIVRALCLPREGKRGFFGGG